MLNTFGPDFSILAKFVFSKPYVCRVFSYAWLIFCWGLPAVLFLRGYGIHAPNSFRGILSEYNEGTKNL